MFSLSAKGHYGLLAVFEIALNYNKKRMQIMEIAEKQKIPHHFLEQLLLVLKKGGFVRSFRGKQGGYELMKTPEEISILDIVQCLDGKLKIAGKIEKNILFDFFWSEVEVKIKGILNISLSELIMKKQGFDKHLMFNI